MLTQKIELKPDDLVKPGDVIELNFRLNGPLWWKATVSAMIDKRLAAKFDNYQVQSYEWLDDKLIIIVKVITPSPVSMDQPIEANTGAVVIAVAISAAVLGSALIYWLTQDTTYKIVETATPAISLLAIAGIFYFALRLFGKGGLSA